MAGANYAFFEADPDLETIAAHMVPPVEPRLVVTFGDTEAGTARSVALVSDYIGWRGPYLSILVLDGVPAVAVDAEELAFAEVSEGVLVYPTAQVSADAAAGMSFPTFGSMQAPVLFQRDQKVFYLAGAEKRGWLADHVALIEVMPDGAVVPRCLVRLYPNMQEVVTREPMGDVDARLAKVRWGPNACGTATPWAWARADTEYEKAILDVVVRPWAIRSEMQNRDPWHDIQTIYSYFRFWGLSDPVSWRDASNANIDPYTFVDYYQRAFGMDRMLAREASMQAVAHLMDKAINAFDGFLANFELGGLVLYRGMRFSPPLIDQYDAFVEQVRIQVEMLLRTQGPGTSNEARAEYERLLWLGIYGELDSKLLQEFIAWGAPVGAWMAFPAVMRPDVLRLVLEHGADPNARSGADPDTIHGFGKTPLMYAAHLNQEEAVALLLEVGADSNARTDLEPDGCGIQIGKRGRTALMYAAENAWSLAIIKQLIEAGADVAVTDTQGNLALDYLNDNPRLNDSAEARALLTPVAQ